MDSNQSPFLSKKSARLAAENTALDGCREDMSDVYFKVGGSASLNTLKWSVLLIAFPAFRIWLRSGEETRSTDMALMFVIAVLTIAVTAAAYISKKKGFITVSGKTVSYNGNCWTDSDISYVICSSFGCIQVYSAEEKILSFLWETDNSELFIAWVKKCGIAFVDKRP